MLISRTFGVRDAELQSTLMALHNCHYRVHEDVVGIFLHDDFRAEALRGEYYATKYLRHRLPLLFRLALCKWRPHRRPQKKPLLRGTRKGGLNSADRLSFLGRPQNGDGDNTESDDDDEDGEDGTRSQNQQCLLSHRRLRCHRGSSGGARSTGSFGNSLATSAAEGCSSSLLSGGDASISDNSQRETWSPEHSPVPAASSSTAAGAAAAAQSTGSASPAPTKEENGLTREQQMQLSILAVQILSGDRSRVREGSAEAVTAACGPIWDTRTVRSFYDDHRRLVRWTCRVLHASCGWVEDVVRLAVDDELLESPAPADRPTRQTNSSSKNDASYRDVVESTAPLASSSPLLKATTRRTRQRRTVPVEARHLPLSTDNSPRKPRCSSMPVEDAVEPHQHAATPDGCYVQEGEEGEDDTWRGGGDGSSTHTGVYTTSNDFGSKGQELTSHCRGYCRHRSAPPLPMASKNILHPPLQRLPPVTSVTASESLHTAQPHGDPLSSSSIAAPPPPPTHPPPPQSSSERTTFVSKAELEALLQLHCRRIRHALMVLESLLVSLVMVQSYIYRTKPGRSNTPPWLRRDSSSNSSGSGSIDDDGSDINTNSGSEDDGSTSDQKCNEYYEKGFFMSSGVMGRNKNSFLNGGTGGFPKRRRHRKRASKSDGMRNSVFEFRVDTCSSFDTDHGDDKGHDEAYIMQMNAEADEPPLDLLVRHCLHAFTQTFLSITTVQQQLQEYSHESRHESRPVPAPASLKTTTTNRFFAADSATNSIGECSSPRFLSTYNSGSEEKGLCSVVSSLTPTESESPSLVAARGTAAAYACPKCQRFHQVEEVLLVAANDNLEVLKKTAIAFAAHHSAIAEESIRVIDAEGAVFTSQATMLLAHVLTPDLLAAHPPGSRGGMALEWVLNYVFGGCNGADVRQHQQQQQRQHIASVADANSSFDCFSLANSSFSSTKPQSVDASDPDGRSSDGGWHSQEGDPPSNASDSGRSSAQSSGRWNVSRFECGDDATDMPLQYRSINNTNNHGNVEAPQREAAQVQPERQAANMRVEYVLAACFTRCHPLMTVIGCVAENNQYNCGRTVAQAVLQYAFTLSQTSARLLRTPLLTNTWSTPFTEAMMRGLSELAAHAHQSIAVTTSTVSPVHGGNGGAGNSGGAGAANLTWSFASSSPANAAVSTRVGSPPQLMSSDRSFAPLLAAQLNVPTSVVSSAMRHVPRPKPYSFIPPPAAVVTGATPADESEAAQVRTMRRCLALHWAKCVLLSARTLTRVGTYDVSVPFEHYVNIRNARVHLRGRMMEYHDRMRGHFLQIGNHEKVKRLDEVFDRWEADERRLLLNDLAIAEDPNGSFTTTTAPYTAQGTPTTPGLQTAEPCGRVSPAPVSWGDAVNPTNTKNNANTNTDTSDPQTAENTAVQSHFDVNRNSYTMTAGLASIAAPAGPNSSGRIGTTGLSDPVKEQLLLLEPDDSNPGSAGADLLGRSFDGTNGTAMTEKESYRRAFVDSFCFGKSDFELLSAALLGKSRTAVQVPIHVIVYTSLFSILDAMGDVLLCEKPRLSSVVANELLTLLYEAQLSMLEPLHNDAMAVVERTGSITPINTTNSSTTSQSSSSSSLVSTPVEDHPDSNTGDTTDSFVSPGSSFPLSAASSVPSVSLSSDDGGRQPASVQSPTQFNSDREGVAFDERNSESCINSSSDREGVGGSRGGAGKAEKKHKGNKSPRKHADGSAIIRDGHILLFNEYALLLEAGLRTSLVVRRWRDDVRSNPNHAARGYLSLLDHLQYRQSQWAEPSQDEYLVSRSTLRLMLGVTACDARGNMHGNILHVDDLDVMGSRKEEVAPLLGVSASKDSMTMMYSEEWDPSMVDSADAQPHIHDEGSAPSDSTNSSAEQVLLSKGLPADLTGSKLHGSDDVIDDHAGGLLLHGGGEADMDAVQLSSLMPHIDRFEAGGMSKDSANAVVTRRHSVMAHGMTMSAHNATSVFAHEMSSISNGSSAHLKSSTLLGRPSPPTSAGLPIQGTFRLLGPRTSSFECVSLLGTKLETNDDDTPMPNSSMSNLHQHYHGIIRSYVDSDDVGDDSDGADDVNVDEEEEQHRHLRQKQENSHDGNSLDDSLGSAEDLHSHCAACAREGVENFSFVSAETYEEGSDEKDPDAVNAAAAAAHHHTSAAHVGHPTSCHHAHGESSSINKSSPYNASSPHKHPHVDNQHDHHDYGGSSHASHVHGCRGSGGRHVPHGIHTRPPYAPWRHVPTRVTLAGAPTDMDTMVKRMPYTWTLTESLAAESTTSATAAATRNTWETPSGDHGDSSGDCRTDVRTTTAATALVVVYAPVTVTSTTKQSTGAAGTVSVSRVIGEEEKMGLNSGGKRETTVAAKEVREREHKVTAVGNDEAAVRGNHIESAANNAALPVGVPMPSPTLFVSVAEEDEEGRTSDEKKGDDMQRQLPSSLETSAERNDAVGGGLVFNEERKGVEVMEDITNLVPVGVTTLKSDGTNDATSQEEEAAATATGASLLLSSSPQLLTEEANTVAESAPVKAVAVTQLCSCSPSTGSCSGCSVEGSSLVPKELEAGEGEVKEEKGKHDSWGSRDAKNALCVSSSSSASGDRINDSMGVADTDSKVPVATSAAAAITAVASSESMSQPSSTPPPRSSIITAAVPVSALRLGAVKVTMVGVPKLAGNSAATTPCGMLASRSFALTLAGTPIFSPPRSDPIVSGRAPLGIGSCSPSNDAALSRAIHRVLRHHRCTSAPPGLPPARLASFNGELPCATPAALSPPPSLLMTAFYERGEVSNCDNSNVGTTPNTSSISGVRRQELSTATMSPAAATETVSTSRHRTLTTREKWHQTLSQLKQIAAETASSARLNALPPSDDAVISERVVKHNEARSAEDRRRWPNNNEKDECVMATVATSTDNIRLFHEGRNNSDGGLRRPSPTATATNTDNSNNTSGSCRPATAPAGSLGAALALQPMPAHHEVSTDAISPNSPSTSSSAPHDLQWFMGGMNTIHQPLRINVSIEDPTSPTTLSGRGVSSDMPSRLSAGESRDSSPLTALHAQVTAEGVMDRIRIGQGGGRWLLWSADGRARQRSPPPDRVNSTAHATTPTTTATTVTVSGAMRAPTGDLQGHGHDASTNRSTPASSCEFTTSCSSNPCTLNLGMATTVPGMQHSSAHTWTCRSGDGATSTTTSTAAAGAGNTHNDNVRKSMKFSTSHTSPIITTQSSGSNSKHASDTQALAALPTSWAVFNGNDFTDGERGPDPLSHHRGRHRNVPSDSPLNSWKAGTADYASSNDSDVST